MKRFLPAAVAVLFVLAMPAEASSGDGESTFSSALVRADGWPVCGFPPDSRKFDYDHRAAVRIARCLNRRGYLLDSALISYELDDTFVISGAWDGAPFDSTLRVSNGEGGMAFTTAIRTSSNLYPPWPALATLAAGLGAVLVIVVLRRRRG